MNLRQIAISTFAAITLMSAAVIGCGGYAPPSFGDDPLNDPPSGQPTNGGSPTTTVSSSAPDTDAGTPNMPDASVDASPEAAGPVLDAGTPAIDASPEAAGPVLDAGTPVVTDAGTDADCGPDAADAGNDSGLAPDGSGLLRLVVSPGGGTHAFTVYFNTLTGQPGEPTWGNPVYTQTASVFDQSVKAFPNSVFITQGYWDPAFAGDWTRQMCNPGTLTLAVTVNAYFQGQALPISVVSNGQGGCNVRLTMPSMR